MDFTFRGVRFNILTLSTRRRVQLWYQNRLGDWELGHAKPVPANMPIIDAVGLMRDYVVGIYDHETYNRLLPEEV